MFAVRVARPADVRRLIEARFQLDHRRNFLVCRCRHERLNNLRMLARPVERLLDGEHALVFGGRLNERQNGIVRIVGMVQQNVVPAQLLKQIVGFRGQPQLPGHIGVKFQSLGRAASS